MIIILSEYVGQPFPSEPQKQIIYRLIMELHYYIKAPINELHAALPHIEALEKECQDLDEMQGKPKVNYIIEILAALHLEVKNERNRNSLKEADEGLVSKIVIRFQKKIVKMKAAAKSIYILVGYIENSVITAFLLMDSY